jgi:hypothetical protein
MGRPAWVLSAEDLSTFKMLFDRAKDWVDIEAMVATRSAIFDPSTVRAALTAWLGIDDPRLQRFEDLLATYPLDGQ